MSDQEIINRQAEAEEYLKKHKINDLITNITSHLVFNKPENPKESIIEYLERLKKSKMANLYPPCLFEDQNLQSIFGMLDPSGKGHITYRQYAEALKTLGIFDFDTDPDGRSEDKIKMDAFLREAKNGLNKINATFNKTK
ncbi:unnamed protein product [Brachionus calyciflorus]|uniref:EF-hand domain-containing protein n=1 Tax=Brachionus calyciflorus TaxID=104777 RepID=A0A813QXT4_9BILA|nr:unnamed protein product [Brachionus calyciflorus]